MAQSQILHLDDTDPRIDFRPASAWTAVNNSIEAWNPDGTYHQASSRDSQFYLLFRGIGTGISLYGRKGPGGGILKLLFDGKTTSVDLNSDDPGNSSIRLWSEAGLGDGDHQVYGSTTTAAGQGVANIWVDYFELENTAGTGFDPIWAGTNATNVPKEAIVVNNADSNVRFSDNPTWNASSNARFYSPSTRHTRKNGASVTYTFEGVAIWYYTDVDIGHGYYTVSIDDSPPERLTGRNSAGHLTRQMLWSKKGLSPGQHTFTLTHNDTDGTYVTLDYFRILQSEVPSVPSDSDPFGPSTTSHQAPVSTVDSQSSSNTGAHVLPLAVGLPIGFMVVAGAILFLVLYRRKKRSRMSPDITQDTTQQGGLLPFIMPHSLMVDRKHSRRGVFPPPESTAPPPYTEPSEAGSSISPEMPITSISLTGTSQQHPQDSGVGAPVS